MIFESHKLKLQKSKIFEGFMRFKAPKYDFRDLVAYKTFDYSLLKTS